MAGKLTLMEMAALYSSKGTHPQLIFDTETETETKDGKVAAVAGVAGAVGAGKNKLPGVSVAEKVHKLFQKRQ
jgi:hypothetical protein